jgi:hypothetical protein
VVVEVYMVVLVVRERQDKEIMVVVLHLAQLLVVEEVVRVLLEVMDREQLAVRVVMDCQQH